MGDSENMLKVKQLLFVFLIITVLTFLGISNSGAENSDDKINSIEISEVEIIDENIFTFEEELFTVPINHNINKKDALKENGEIILTSAEKISSEKKQEKIKKKTNEIVFTVGDVSVRYEDIEFYYEDDFKPYQKHDDNKNNDLNEENIEENKNIINEKTLEKEIFVSFEEELEKFNIPAEYFGKDFKQYDLYDENDYEYSNDLIDVPIGNEKDIYKTSYAVEFSYTAPDMLEVPYREEEEDDGIVNEKESNEKKSSLPTTYDNAFYVDRRENPYEEYAYYYMTRDFEDFE